VSKLISILAISLLVIFNVFLLYNDVLQRKKISNLNQIKNSMIKKKLIQDKFEIDNIKYQKSNSPLALYVFIPSTSCSTCLIYEIRNLKHFYKSFSTYTSIYVVGTDSSFLKRFSINFPYITINSIKQIFNKKIIFNDPIVLLLDSNNNIQELYIAQPGNETKSNHFYQRMTSLFSSLQEKQPESPSF
jgi:hypothetical protein